MEPQRNIIHRSKSRAGDWGLAEILTIFSEILIFIQFRFDFRRYELINSMILQFPTTSIEGMCASWWSANIRLENNPGGVLFW